jgi:cytochrome c556
MRMPLLKVMALCLALVSFSVNPAVAGENQKAETINKSVPASLDAYYPPQSPAPAYLLAMMNMERPFSAMVNDIFENDLANAKADFQAFKKSYIDISGMVPEWKQDFPLQPVEELGVALETGDPKKIMPAVEKAGKNCHPCHVTYMAPVQQKYAWDQFRGISVTDPLSGQEVNYADLMQMLNTNFAGLGADVMQGQRQKAQTQLEGFNARFQAMADACMDCHDSERKYYVDESVKSVIANLQLELNKPEINAEAVGGLMDTIGKESCGKCHLVHIPAAYGQQLMGAHK